MKDKYIITPEGLLAEEARIDFSDAKLILHAIKRYAFSINKNAIIFTKKGNIIFAKVHKGK